MTKLGKYLKASILLYNILYVNCLKLTSIDNTYQKGVDAYSGERWSECIAQFEESLHLYKLYKTININCRHKCNTQHFESIIKENIEDLKIFEMYLNKRNCLSNCQKKSFEDVHILNEIKGSVLHSMQTRKPYEHLHVCYFQMNAVPKAASAAYTYLVAHPNDETMKNNMAYYIEQSEVDVNEIVDLESEDYEVLYKLGLKAYNKMNWGETIASMEEVLTDYISWENSCRAECEQQPQEKSSEFILTISYNMAHLMHCQQKCQNKLVTINYNSGVEFLCDILNYLQLSYYKLDRFEDAVKAATTYLVMMPNDKDMLDNKEIYKTLVDETAFVERSDIIHYFKRDEYEKKLLNFFHQEIYDDLNYNAV